MFVTESFAAVPDGGLRVAAGGIFFVPKIQARVSECHHLSVPMH